MCVEKRREALVTLLDLQSNEFDEEIRNTIVSLLDKPDLEEIELPGVDDIIRAVLPDQEHKEPWIAFEQARHPGAGIAFSGNKSLLTIALSGTALFRIDTQSGLIKSVSNVRQPLQSPIALSPNGDFVAGWLNGAINVWDLERGLLGKLEEDGVALPVRYLVFDPTSRLLAAINGDAFSVWEVSPLRLLCRTPSTGRYELSDLGSVGISFNPDGAAIAMAQISDGGRLIELKLWSVPECRLLTTVNIENSSHDGSSSFDPFSRIAFHPDGQTLFQALGAQGIAKWNLADDLTATLDGIIQHGRGATSISVSPDGRWLLTSNESFEVSLWASDGSSRGIVVPINESEETVILRKRDIRHLQFASLGNYVFWTTNKDVHLWRFHQPLSREVDSSFRFVSRYDWSVTSAVLSPSGRWLIISQGNRGQRIRLVDLDRTILEAVPVTSFVVGSAPVVFLPDTDRFWVLGDTIELWSPEANEPEKSEPLPVFWVSDGAIDSTGHRIATRFGSVFDLDDGTSLLSVGSQDDKHSLSYFDKFDSRFSPDGSHYLVVEGQKNTDEFSFELYQIREGRMLLKGDGLNKVSSLSLANNAYRFVLGTQDGALIFTPTSSNPERKLAGPSGDFAVVSISPDGKLVASAGPSGRINVWDVEEGRKLFTFSDQEVTTLTIRNKQPLLVSGHMNGSVRIWDLNEVEEAVSRFGRESESHPKP